MSPLAVTAALNMAPTEVKISGESIVSSIGRVRLVKKSYWLLSSKGLIESKDVRRHLDWLTAQLTPVKSALLRLQDVPGVKMFVDCKWSSRGGMGGPTLWPEQMLALAELNLECGFDVFIE